ncbi:hypothetical protein A0H81_01089 [Grifola frondosa]|uniref:Uncharacterized protein n=1 Tax=Grifola frondosa TaxID=5627 RepID=A0A1C7MSV3_GRIFR|nr:hypothetical protein A0H81_01089 [Grifola frondosa]
MLHSEEAANDVEDDLVARIQGELLEQQELLEDPMACFGAALPLLSVPIPIDTSLSYELQRQPHAKEYFEICEHAEEVPVASSWRPSEKLMLVQLILYREGIATTEDAILAYEAGMQCIVFLNHSGRYLDTSCSGSRCPSKSSLCCVGTIPACTSRLRRWWRAHEQRAQGDHSWGEGCGRGTFIPLCILRMWPGGCREGDPDLQGECARPISVGAEDVGRVRDEYAVAGWTDAGRAHSGDRRR